LYGFTDMSCFLSESDRSRDCGLVKVSVGECPLGIGECRSGPAKLASMG
jgi:hypothetical protein